MITEKDEQTQEEIKSREGTGVPKALSKRPRLEPPLSLFHTFHSILLSTYSESGAVLDKAGNKT